MEVFFRMIFLFTVGRFLGEPFAVCVFFSHGAPKICPFLLLDGLLARSKRKKKITPLSQVMLGCPIGSAGIKGDRISGLQPQYIPFISRRNNPYLLTLDPNFVGHPSGLYFCQEVVWDKNYMFQKLTNVRGVRWRYPVM